MRRLIVNIINRRGISRDVGKIARDILIADHSASEKDNCKIGSMRQGNSKNSVTHKWLQKAMKINHNNSKRADAIIYLPILLKTLQKLRSSDNTSVYFALLNKIQASDITWILQNGIHIKRKHREGVPLELYHETSNMVYRMSLSCSKFTDSRALAIFGLRLMNEYKKLGFLNLNRRVPYQTKFYKNCLLVVVKSESIFALLDAFKELPQNQYGLKILGELAFYHQTGQVTKVMDVLEEIVHMPLSNASITKEQIRAFSTPLLNILQTCLQSGEEELSRLVLKKLRGHWSYTMDDHSLTILKDLSEKMGMDRFLFSLAEGRQDIESQITRKKMSWCEYINNLHQARINLFQEELAFDYSQTILSSVGTNIEDWKTFIDSNPLPADANESLKAFYVNAILVELASQKNIGFMVSILEFLVYERQFHQDLLSSRKLAGFTKSCAFHAVIKAISNSDSAKITACILHDFLKKHHSNIGFQFSNKDYGYLMKTCAYRTDNFTFYYFFYHFLKEQLNALRTDQEFFEWCLPHQISVLLNQIKNPTLSRKINEIEKNAKAIFTERRLNGSEVTDSDLQKLFGEDKFLHKTSIKSLLPIVTSGDQLGRTIIGEHVYYPSIDVNCAKRLSHCLDRIIIHSSPIRP